MYNTPTPEQLELKNKSVKFKNNQGIEMKIIKNNDTKQNFFNFVTNLETLFKFKKELVKMENDDDSRYIKLVHQYFVYDHL